MGLKFSTYENSSKRNKVNIFCVGENISIETSLFLWRETFLRLIHTKNIKGHEKPINKLPGGTKQMMKQKHNICSFNEKLDQSIYGLLAENPHGVESNDFCDYETVYKYAF